MSNDVLARIEFLKTREQAANARFARHRRAQERIVFDLTNVLYKEARGVFAAFPAVQALQFDLTLEYPYDDPTMSVWMAEIRPHRGKGAEPMAALLPSQSEKEALEDLETAMGNLLIYLNHFNEEVREFLLARDDSFNAFWTGLTNGSALLTAKGA